MAAGGHVRPALARVLGMLVLHTCMCTLGGQMAGSAALTAITEALPRAVQGHEDEDAGRQAEMAVSWGLFNQQRKESGELESASGPGSSGSFTHVTRDYLQDVIERYSVRSIVDVACGDWNWMRQIDLAALGVESYVGLDINGNIIAENQRLYSSNIVSFQHASILTSGIPAADLVIARDILFHLNTNHICTVLAAVHESKSKLLLTTSFPWLVENEDLPPRAEAYLGFAPQPERPVWGYREVNLDIAPFDLGAASLESVEETWGDDDDDVTSTRLFKLYSLSQANASCDLKARSSMRADDDAGMAVRLKIVQAVPGLALVVEWSASRPAGFGDWIGLFREDGNAAAGEWWSEESQVWQAAVADKATHGLIASNLSAPDKFVLPQGGPWRLAYFDASDPLPRASILAQDPATLFVVTSLTGYSSRRNQFITQLLFHMEYLWFARNVLNTAMVAPTFVLNPRNHTRYEEAISDAKASGKPLSEDFKAILGLLPVDFHELFDEAALAEYSAGLTSRESFEEPDHVIDLLIVVDAWAIYGQACSSQPRCDYYGCKTEPDDTGKGPLPRSMEFYGKLFSVQHVHCVPHEASGEALREEILGAHAVHRRRGGGTRIAVAAVIVDHLFAEERPRGLREHWADDPVDGLHFRQILSHLKPAAHIQQHLAVILEEHLRGGFVAAHWRRGDRGHPEMGSYGQHMHELSGAENFACNLNSMLKETGSMPVFVATNSGSDDEIAVVKQLTGARVLLLRDLHVLTGWKHEYEALVAEMFLCARAERFLAAGSGEYYLTSSISRLIMRMRRVLSFAPATDAYLVSRDPAWCRSLCPAPTDEGVMGKPLSMTREGMVEGRVPDGDGRNADRSRGDTHRNLGGGTRGDGSRRRGMTMAQAGWEEPDDDVSFWRGAAAADAKECCPGGTAVEQMECARLREWLLCIGAMGDEDLLPCSDSSEGANTEDGPGRVNEQTFEKGTSGEGLAMMLASGSESDISEELPALDAARVVRCRSFETRGVLYSAYDLASAKGYATLLELRNSVFSLRNFADLRYLEKLDFPDLVEADAGVDEGPFESMLLDAFLGITVVTDVDVDAEDGGGADKGLLEDLRRMKVNFVHVDAEGHLHSAFKLRAMVSSPYKRTLYLDKDTVVCQSVTAAFDLMPRFDLIATQASVSFYEGQPEAWSEASGLQPLPLSYIQYCAAVIFFRQSARVRDMFRLAVREADRLHPDGYLDQAALRNALFHSPRVRDYTLTPSWQCRGAHACATSYASPQVIQDRAHVGAFVGESCILLHQHALQDTDPRKTITKGWDMKPNGRARFAWDQGLYTYELLPLGIPSRHHYLRNDRSALYADLVEFSEAWMRAPSPGATVTFQDVAERILGVGNANFVHLWNRRWEYPFHTASLRFYERHLAPGKVEGKAQVKGTDMEEARLEEADERLRVLVAGGEGGFFPQYLAAKMQGWAVSAIDLDERVMEAYREMKAIHSKAALLRDPSGCNFDAVLAISVLHHVDLKEAAVQELRRVLRPRGLFSVSLTLAHCSACTTDQGYHSLAGAQNLLQAIVGAGFEEVAGTESVNKDIKVAAGSEKQILSSTWMAGEDRRSMPWSLGDAHEHLTVSCHVFRSTKAA